MRRVLSIMLGMLLLCTQLLAQNHTIRECSVFDFGDAISYYIRNRAKEINPKLKENSCCFRCFLPTPICSAIRASKDCNRRTVNFISTFFIFCIEFLDKLKLRATFGLEPSRAIDYNSFVPLFFKKVYLSHLDTEGILGLQILQTILVKRIQVLKEVEEE